MANLILRDSGASSLRPEFALEVTPERRQAETPIGAGAVFSRQINERAIRSWRLQWTTGTRGQHHLLTTAWADSRGGVLRMDYLTEDNAETVTVRFVPESLRVAQTSASVFRMSVEIEEDLSAHASYQRGDWNMITFLIDDLGADWYKQYDNTHWNEPSPAARLDPIATEWANRWGEVSQNESAFAYPPTPVLDDLAKNGVVLTRMNVAAMCSPTRASLLTGRHSGQHRLGQAIQFVDPVPLQAGFGFDGETIYELLRDQGSNYERLHVGKWHCTNPFFMSVNGLPLGVENTEAAYRAPVERAGASYYQGGLSNWITAPGFTAGGDPSDTHARHSEGRHDARANPRFDPAFRVRDRTDANALIEETEIASRLIQDAAADGKPFVMNVEYHAVHAAAGWGDIGGAELSTAGYHSYGTANPADVASNPNTPPAIPDSSVGNVLEAESPNILKAFTESVDTSMGLIIAAMTADQRAKTIVVFLSDNGSASINLAPDVTLDTLESPKETIPSGADNPYNVSHSKRGPWQGGVHAACVINGPLVENPGDGTIPRFWDGLCGVEDVYRLMAELSGAFLPEAERNDANVLMDAIRDTTPTGRDTYNQRAYQNGWHADPYNPSQPGLYWINSQNDAGWKLMWGEISGAPSGSGLLTGHWQLYDMINDFEDVDIYGLAWTGNAQTTYDAMTGAQQTQFAHLYRAIEADDAIPPGWEINL